MRQLIGILIVALLAGGCSGEKRSFQVSVKNDTLAPLTIGQVKDGPPYEELWATPEDLAIRHARGGDQVWGVVVAPGKTRSTEVFEGDFQGSTGAWLRIYSGRLSFSELLAISNRSPNRVDVRLHQGVNRITVSQATGALTATHDQTGTPAPGAATDSSGR